MVKAPVVIEPVELGDWLYDHTTGDHRVYKCKEVAGIVVIPASWARTCRRGR